MKNLLGQIRPVKAATLTMLALVLAVPTLPVLAQDTQAETRLRRLESEMRALQRQVFPGGDGKFFAPEITPGATPGGAAAASVPATTPITDLLTRMETIEGQIARLTAQVEVNTNKLAQLEARVGGADPAAPVASPSSAAPATAAADFNLSAMTGGASAPRPAPSPAASAAPAPRPAASAPAPQPTATKPAVSKPAVIAAPSAQRVAAVRAIAKPQTNDPGDDEYSYGFRLWEAKFFPEAQQQLKLMVDKYPRHARISFARNLLGRAYLDDGKPREAATWFLQNYQASKTGERASDSLLLLAESMRRLNDKSRACIALAEFGQTYPAEAAGRLKAQYDATKAGVKCN